MCRFDKRDCHLALPYYKMSGLSLTEVISRNRGLSNSLCGYGKGFLFFLKHSLYEETLELLTEVTFTSLWRPPAIPIQALLIQ